MATCRTLPETSSAVIHTASSAATGSAHQCCAFQRILPAFVPCYRALANTGSASSCESAPLASVQGRRRSHSVVACTRGSSRGLASGVEQFPARVSDSRARTFKGLSPQEARGRARFSHRLRDSQLSWDFRSPGLHAFRLAADFAAGSLHMLGATAGAPTCISRFRSTEFAAGNRQVSDLSALNPCAVPTSPS